ELLARVRAALRREEGPAAGTTFTIGHCVVDLAAYTETRVTAGVHVPPAPAGRGGGGAHRGRGAGRLVRQRGDDRPASGRGGRDEVDRRVHGRHARGTGGGADGVRVHLADPRAARGRSAPYLCRVHARTGRCGHAAESGRD